MGKEASALPVRQDDGSASASAAAVKVKEGATGSPVTAHPVDTPTRRRRSRAQIHPLEWQAVRVEPHRRSKEGLAHAGKTTVDVATDAVGIGTFKFRRRRHVVSEPQLTEARIGPHRLPRNLNSRVVGRLSQAVRKDPEDMWILR